jgi:hypothetical protein
VKVVTNAKTTFSETVKGTVADLKRGDHVIVTGDTSGSSVSATNIVDNGDQELGFARRDQGAPDGSGNGNNLPTPPGGNGGNGGKGGGFFAGGSFTAGTVTDVNGSTVTLKSNDGSTVTVNTSSSTNVTVTKKISLADLKVGDEVRVTGSTSDNTVTAERVQKGDLGGGFGDFGRRQQGDATPPTTTN